MQVGSPYPSIHEGSEEAIIAGVNVPCWNFYELKWAAHKFTVTKGEDPSLCGLKTADFRIPFIALETRFLERERQSKFSSSRHSSELF